MMHMLMVMRLLHALVALLMTVVVVRMLAVLVALLLTVMVVRMLAEVAFLMTDLVVHMMAVLVALLLTVLVVRMLAVLVALLLTVVVVRMLVNVIAILITGGCRYQGGVHQLIELGYALFDDTPALVDVRANVCGVVYVIGLYAVEPFNVPHLHINLGLRRREVLLQGAHV